MKQISCKCCGGNLRKRGFDTLVCEYCGAEYRDEDGMSRVLITQVPARTETFRTMIVADEMMVRDNPVMASEHIMKQMANKLAESIIGCVAIDTEYDPIHMQRKFTGTIKCVKPSPENLRWWTE